MIKPETADLEAELCAEAIDYDGLECPNNSPVVCAASVAGCMLLFKSGNPKYPTP